MHVVQLITKPQRRGAELFALDLSTALSEFGVRSTILSLYRHDGEQLPLRPQDVNLGGNERGRRERLADPVLAAKLAASLHRLQPDVVQANGGRSLKYAGLVRGVLHHRSVWIYRNIDSPAFWLRSWAARTVLPRVVRATFDGAVCVSRTTLGEVRRFYGFDSTSVTIENGVDFRRLSTVRSRTEVRAELQIDEACPVALFVGALAPQKRPDRLAPLLAAVPDLKLVVLGEGTARAQLECSIRERGVAHRVRILGNRGDVGAIMRACDFLVVTSDTDGIPAAVIEAQHCGLPVVSFAVGGVAEAIDSDSGILVMAGDEAGLAAAVASLVLDRKRREALAAGARRNSVRFDIRSVAQRYLSFYRERIEAFGAS